MLLRIQAMVRNPNLLAIVLTCWSVFCSQMAGNAPAQEVRAVAPPIHFEAVPGEPFGVGTLQIPLPAPLVSEALRVTIFEANNRVFYPVSTTQAVELELKPTPPSNRRVGQGRLVQRLRESIKEMRDFRADPRVVTIRFLFRGNEPLKLQVVGTLTQTVEVKVADNKRCAQFPYIIIELI